MAPILIDSRDILKLGFAAVLATMLVFAVGFFIGHQRAATFYLAGSESQRLPLPEPLLVDQANVGSKVPVIIEAGESIDVDHPETVVENALEKNKVSVLHTEKSPEVPAVAHRSELSSDELTAEKTPSHSQDKNHKNKADKNNWLSKEIVSSVGASIVSTSSMSDLSKVKYTIQVGVYGRLVNAENMVKMLQAQQYDAYVTDYTNKKNEIRYNVRLGYFSDRKSATAKLTDFKTSQNGDGYLVRFSAKNIVNLAGADKLQKAVANPSDKDNVTKTKTEQGLAPVTIPSGLIQDNLSQSGVLDNTLAVKN